MEFFEYSLASFRDEAIKLARAVDADGYRPDCVAYLAKGAWQIGKVCAEYFGTPVIELSSHRSGESAKVHAQELLARLPRFARHVLRSAEMSYRLRKGAPAAQTKSMRITDRYPLPENAIKLLVVDDAADTGGSLESAKSLLAEVFPDAQIRTAVINSSSLAKLRGLVDWFLYEDVLLCTPMSKDSHYYNEALLAYGEDR